jgi:hypothetical protein
LPGAELGTNLDRAIMLAEKAIDLDSTKAIYHDTLAWCYYKNRNIYKARACMNIAIKMDLDNTIFQEHKKEIETTIINTKQSRSLLND